MPRGNLETLFPVAPQVQELIGLRRHTLEPHSPDFNTYFFRVLNEGQILHQLFSTFVIKISASVVVKFGTCRDISEYQTMCYVWSHREGIPMTEPLGAVSIGDSKYFFMSYVEGDALAKVWPGLSPDMKSSVRSQLEEILGCLRRVPLPSKYLGSGEPPLCRDAPRHIRVSENSITTEEEFKAFLLSNPRERNPVYMDLISSALETNHEIVMTHADLRPENIIVSYTAPDTIKINGLIDWEFGGAYPGTSGLVVFPSFRHSSSPRFFQLSLTPPKEFQKAILTSQIAWWEYVNALGAVNWDLSDWYSYLPLNAIGEHKEEWRFLGLAHGLVT